MKLVEQLSFEVSPSINPLRRRFANTVDRAEQRVIVDVIDSLNRKLRALDRAELLEAPSTLGDASDDLEKPSPPRASARSTVISRRSKSICAASTSSPAKCTKPNACVRLQMTTLRWPHDGDSLTTRTLHVPAGRPLAGSPPFTWRESAVDALRASRDSTR